MGERLTLEHFALASDRARLLCHRFCPSPPAPPRTGASECALCAPKAGVMEIRGGRQWRPLQAWRRRPGWGHRFSSLPRHRSEDAVVKKEGTSVGEKGTVAPLGLSGESERPLPLVRALFSGRGLGRSHPGEPGDCFSFSPLPGRLGTSGTSWPPVSGFPQHGDSDESFLLWRWQLPL